VRRSIRNPQISGGAALVCVDRIRIELFRFGGTRRPAEQPIQLVSLQQAVNEVCRSIRNPRISGVGALVCVDRIRIELLIGLGGSIECEQTSRATDPAGLTPAGGQRSVQVDPPSPN
jgi:hypothetical protein